MICFTNVDDKISNGCIHNYCYLCIRSYHYYWLHY
ncbi:hypothetical protein JKI98_10240 [Acinetobacter nectaris]|nr:hypothetical protein [Acinetobacter nectaris]